jgi:hypothetical protein
MKLIIKNTIILLGYAPGSEGGCFEGEFVSEWVLIQYQFSAIEFYDYKLALDICFLQ